MTHRIDKPQATPGVREALAVWLLGPAFLALAAVILFATPGTDRPSAATPAFSQARLEVAPRRQVLSDPPVAVIGAFEQRCNACHKLFESSWDGKRPLQQHTHIELAHGINSECNNCHARNDRERLVLHDGSTVPYAEVEQLCSQCHGPVFRDWRRGAHGKTLGSWKLDSGQARKLTCSECHDPHRPAYDPIEPMPGPNTLRMGEPPTDGHEHAEERNPLRHWVKPKTRARNRIPNRGAPSMNLRIHEGPGHGTNPRRGVTRRSFLRTSLAAGGGLAALAAALSPLRELDGDDAPTVQDFLQKHYKEMNAEEMNTALDRIRADVERRYEVRPDLRDIKPMDGVEFVYALNLSRCIGCRKCVHACVAENNQSRDPEIQYIRVLEMPRGSIDIEDGNHHYDRPKVPAEDHYYMPIQCHQCANPPCVKVCPVEATWQEPDGITVVDYDWCIGCRYCEAACPYWARRFNFTKPSLPTEQVNPRMSYLSNRPRHQGVMEKCHFCLQRTRQGEMPACLEVCPTGARKFGNVLDPDSEVSQILQSKRVFVLKAEVGTLPRFFYYFDERDPFSQVAPPPPDAPATPPDGGAA